jgi:preprotein translocase subunit SecG
LDFLCSCFCWDYEYLEARTDAMKILRIIAAIFFCIITLIFAITTIYRCTWDYNEMGNHFSEESMTNYNDGAIGFYGLLTFLFLIPSILLVVAVFRRQEQKK